MLKIVLKVYKIELMQRSSRTFITILYVLFSHHSYKTSIKSLPKFFYKFLSTQKIKVFSTIGWGVVEQKQVGGIFVWGHSEIRNIEVDFFLKKNI